MKNILVLTGWTYRSGLIQTYTLPYVRMMRANSPPDGRIHLVTLEQPAMALTSQEKARAREALAADGIEWTPLSYRRFGLGAVLQAAYHVFLLLRLCRAAGVGRIHCFCTPAGTLGYVLSRLTGIPLILDSYEPHAESMSRAAGSSEVPYLSSCHLRRPSPSRSSHSPRPGCCVAQAQASSGTTAPFS